MNGENESLEPLNEEAFPETENAAEESAAASVEEAAPILVEEEPSVEMEELRLDDDEVEDEAEAEIEALEAALEAAEEEGDDEAIRIVASDETLQLAVVHDAEDDAAPEEAEEVITASREELKPVIEAILFVADEPLPFKHLCKILGEVGEEDVQAALAELVAEYEARNSGLEIREIAGGWRISTRPQNHEFIRKYLKSRPTARLSLPALETLAVIAYKQPITIPEILEIRGVTSSSAIKTLLEKRLIVTKGRKETVGRPMMYGTSREFLIQFGLKDLSELPSIEDFEDLAQ